MELKVMEEVHEVNYPTYEDSKNNLWKLLINSKSISISSLCLYLLISQSISASIPDFAAFEEVGGSVITAVITPKEIAIGLFVIVLSITVLITIIVKISKRVAKKISNKKQEKNE